MKTKHLMIAASCLTLLIAQNAFAQISVGTRQGITFSTLSGIGDIYDNDQIVVSYTGGLFITLPVKGSYSFVPEVNYIRKGRSSETTATSSTSLSTHYDYLQVPLLARYTTTLSNTEKCAVYFNAGPYAAYLLKSQSKQTGSNDWIENPDESGDKNPDFGIVAGGGITVPVNKMKFQFELRYDMGLSKVNNQPDDYRTKALSLTAGVLF